MKKGQLITICIIIFGLITGAVIYYYAVDPEERIYIESYDRTVEFELGNYEVESITNNVNDLSNNTSFKVDNEEDFVSSVITSNESFVGMLNYTVSEFESTIYYFIEDSYCYYVRPYGDNEFVLMTCSNQFTTNEYSAEIPFIPFAYVEYDVKYEYSDMNSSNFLAF